MPKKNFKQQDFEGDKGAATGDPGIAEKFASKEPSKEGATPVVPAADNADGSGVEKTAVKEDDVPKTVVNAKKTAELVGDAATALGGISTSLRSAARITFGGGAGAVAGDSSANLKRENIRKSGDRTGRIIDSDLRHLDEATSEIHRVHIETIPMLQGGADAEIGYNGTYENEHEITEKISGGAPQSKKFFRTVDMQTYDQLYFCDGQLLKATTNSAYKGEDPLRISLSHYSRENGYNRENITLTNVLDQELHLTIKFDNTADHKKGFISNARVTGFNVESMNIGANKVDETTGRLACDWANINSNIAETDRLNMVRKAGNEAKDNFCPLGEVVDRASSTNRFLGEMEAEIGDIMFLAGRKGQHAYSFQLTKAAKDGLRKVGPIFEFLEGQTQRTITNRDADIEDHSHIEESVAGLFEPEAFRRGSAALYIALNDSTRKYNTKGKIMSLPLSLKTAFNTFKGNCQGFRMHKKFYNEIQRGSVFGEVAGNYTGLHPTFLTNGESVIREIPSDVFWRTEKTSETNDKLRAPMLLTAHAEDLRNEYNYPVYNYLVQGLLDYFNREAVKLADLCCEASNLVNGENEVTIDIPMVNTVTSISLWDLFLCAASKDIISHRYYAMECVQDYVDNNGEYPYSLSIEMPEDVAQSDGLTFSGLENGLGKVAIPSNIAIRLLMPELMYSKASEPFEGIDGDKIVPGGRIQKVILPWYFNQDQFNLQNNVLINRPGESSVMTFFDRRGGIRSEQIDSFLDMDLVAMKLAMDRMVVYPGYRDVCTTFNSVMDNPYIVAAHKWDFSEDGIPVIPYITSCNIYGDARPELSSLQNVNAPNAAQGQFKINYLSLAQYLATPRELGMSMIAPDGVCSVSLHANHVALRSGSDPFFNGGLSFKLWMWTPADPTDPNFIKLDEELDADQKLDRRLGAGLRQYYYTYTDTPDRVVLSNGLSFNPNEDINVNKYVPFVNIVSNANEFDFETGTYYGTGRETQVHDENYNVEDNYRYLYTCLSYLPFVINPYTAYWMTNAPQEPSRVNVEDEFSLMRFFNICGFRSGCYQGMEFNRVQSRINLGLGYVSDPYYDRRG